MSDDHNSLSEQIGAAIFMITALPIIGISFSLGYLYFFDSRIFLLFSISDHIAFAISRSPSIVFLILTTFLSVVAIDGIGKFLKTRVINIRYDLYFVCILAIALIILALLLESTASRIFFVKILIVYSICVILMFRSYLSVFIGVNSIRLWKNFTSALLLLSFVFAGGFAHAFDAGRETILYDSYTICTKINNRCASIIYYGNKWTISELNGEIFISESASRIPIIVREFYQKR
jgi:hypothetical protein